MIKKYPLIGIRPVIDGRMEGVREASEKQTYNMAEQAKDFLESSLKYPDGSPVKCVIAEKTIGGIKENRDCGDKFRELGVGVSLTVTPCWCYGSETMDYDPSIPKAIWGFNGTERPGAVYLAAVLAAHNQKGLPAFGIYGKDVQNKDADHIPEDVQEKLLQFTKAGLAVAIMRNKSYVAMGSVSMGIAGSIVDDSFFEHYLGMNVEHIDMSELIRRINHEIYDKEEYVKALAWSKEKCNIGDDPNENQKSDSDKEVDWETSVKMTLIARDIMVGNEKLEKIGYSEEAMGHNAIAGGFQGQRHWTDFMPNGDLMETVLNSSFDWNGKRAPYIMATENDSLNGASMLFGYLLTNTAQIFSDVRTYWSPEAVENATGWKPDGMAKNGFIHLINSGSTSMDGTGEQEKNGTPAMKPFWEITDAEVEKCLEATKFCPALLESFRGGGFSTSFTTRAGMKVTMSRINIVEGLGPVLQIAEGTTVELPKDAHKLLNERTNPTWPTTWFVPNLTGKDNFKDVYSVMSNWGANHGAISYGHIGGELITLASILRIPVAMHNVEDSKVFRPSAWSMFGSDSQGADYRACATYKSLY